MAAKWGLSPRQIAACDRREVILVGWGDAHHHSAIKATTWYRQGKMLEHWDLKAHHLVRARFSNQRHPPNFLACLKVFGIPTKFEGLSIAGNSGNQTAFALHLLLAFCFLSPDLKKIIIEHRDLPMLAANVGNGQVLTRTNIPVDATASQSRVAYSQPLRPAVSSFKAITNSTPSSAAVYSLSDVASRGGQAPHAAHSLLVRSNITMAALAPATADTYRLLTAGMHASRLHKDRTAFAPANAPYVIQISRGGQTFNVNVAAIGPTATKMNT
ncbi:Uu.00g059840.m01.CDS01 [Anthostomella pinea]|uniref:Uu.00g059840.m01.CDS01 n=1 Tax=Anthostomella pinea TaxID=933095 RepID=A0AAI8YMF4_9PEZI|nr:Uu.00g059840.m01.CDS01 [Anthostomella pinea]